MNYSDIIYQDTANGIGLRTTIFVSGCTHKCKGCFNPELWDFCYGKEFTTETENEIFNSMNEYIDGITLLGGDPFELKNLEVLLPFIKRFKSKFPDKNIWCYTGEIYDNIIKENNSLKIDALNYIDILVDGPFIESLKKYNLYFKGSTNQRIIDIKESLKINDVKELEIEI